MSYLSATENVGFSGIPQNISDASCATQYKMAVNGLEGVPGNCAEAMYIPDSSGDDQTYISHLNDNFYTKFKIDPNELYTFQDSDVIAGEITVSHTEDAFVFPDTVDVKTELSDSPTSEVDVVGAFTNGDVKEGISNKVLSNGHYNSVTKQIQKHVKTSHTKAQKAKIQVKEHKREPLTETILCIQSPVETCVSPPSTVSINSNANNAQPEIPTKQASGETFLDVFKREQGLVENSTVTVKTEPLALPPPPSPMKAPSSPPKKISSGKTQPSSKQRRGRGPAMHEALQRISRRAIAVPIKKWHAPGEFDGPTSSKKQAFRALDSSSSEDDEMPDIEIGSRPLCIEEIAAESRSARMDFRREAMRKRLDTVNETLRLAKHHTKAKALCSIVKKQLNSGGSSGLPTQTVNHLLAMQGMSSLFTSEERRKLRESGWSGGESGSSVITEICSEDGCSKPSLPCGRYCLAHITLASEQRLYASCAAVFAVGSRCNYPLLPLKDQLPLCAEHAWKRDNYDKLIRDNKPKKVVRPRLLPSPRRPKRRRRPPPPPRIRPPGLAPPAPVPPPPALSQSLSEINVCSNSSTYDSSEDTHMGVLSENEYAAASYPHELEVEVVHDILDPSVLIQMPDEAFTKFLTQEESGTFGEGSELAAALEAVLDERVLDEREVDNGELEETVLEDETLHTMDHDMFDDSPDISVDKIKMEIPASVSMELSSSASS